MSMHHVGWTLRTEDPVRRQELLDVVVEISCDALLLCASVGCACAGGGKKTLCSEQDVPGRFRTRVCDGPRWAIMARDLPACVQLDVYVDMPLGAEVADLHARLLALGVPTFISATTGEY